MKTSSWKILLLAFLFLYPAFAGAGELESVTVAGFVNAGEAKDGNINLMITRSLISFLSKISTNVTPYSRVEEWAELNAFWQGKKLKTAIVIGMANEMSTKTAVSGVYIVGSNDTLAVRVLVHDTATGALKFDHTYRGDTGIDIFDTIDSIIRDVSGQLVGQPVEIGRVKIAVQFPDRLFKLYINDLFAKDLTSDEPYSDNFMADQMIKVSIRDTNDEEVFVKDVFVEKNFTTEVLYAPVGTVRLRVVDGEALILLGGKMMGKTSLNGELTVPDVTAEQPQELVVKIKNEETARYTFTLKDSEIRTLLVNGSNVTETSEIPAITRRNKTLPEDKTTNMEAKTPEQPPAENHRVVYFPLTGGMLGFLKGTYAMAGIDLYPIWGLRIFALGGTVIYNSPALGGYGVIPMANAGLGYTFQFGLFGIGLSASAMMFIGSTFAVEPEVMLEISIWQIFLMAGGRYTLTPGAEGFHPDFRAGIRF